MKIIYERNGETIGREIQSIRTSGKNSIKCEFFDLSDYTRIYSNKETFWLINGISAKNLIERCVNTNVLDLRGLVKDDWWVNYEYWRKK